jgi:hypothetical protein
MTDLKNLLEDLAARAGDVELAEHDVVQRIRRRRRVRTALTGATGVATVAVLAVGAYAAIPSPTAAPASTSTPASLPVKMPLAPYECGVAFPAPKPVDEARRIEVVTLTQKSIRQTSTGWSGVVQSKFLYVGGMPYPVIGGLPPKWIAVVGNGRMVGRATVTTTAKHVELHPGQSNVVDARIEVRSCTGEPLPAGSYQLYQDLKAPTKPTKEPVVPIDPLGTLQLR